MILRGRTIDPVRGCGSETEDDTTMCGIAGFVGRRPPDRSAIEDTLAMMRQRGPDGLGYFEGALQDARVVLLHSRLAIIDPDPRSNQPFVDDGVVLTFNGEIYNYLEVREELKARGHAFVTDSDTEVIVHAYREWGERLVDHLEGMWAFAIFDPVKQQLLLGRDPFGEKPLYTMQTEDGLYFGSEIKFIKELSGRSPSIDHRKVHRFSPTAIGTCSNSRHRFSMMSFPCPPHQPPCWTAGTARRRPATGSRASRPSK